MARSFMESSKIRTTAIGLALGGVLLTGCSSEAPTADTPIGTTPAATATATPGTTPVNGQQPSAWALNFEALSTGNIKGPAAEKFGAENVSQGLKEVIDLHYRELWGPMVTDWELATPDNIQSVLRDHMSGDLTQEYTKNVKIVRDEMPTNGDELSGRVLKAAQYLASTSGFANFDQPAKYRDVAVIATNVPDPGNRVMVKYGWDDITTKVVSGENGAPDRMVARLKINFTWLGVAKYGDQLVPPQPGKNVTFERTESQWFDVTLEPNPTGTPDTRNTWTIVDITNWGAKYGNATATDQTFPGIGTR